MHNFCLTRLKVLLILKSVENQQNQQNQIPNQPPVAAAPTQNATFPTSSKRLYPTITIQRLQNPKRFWAIPLLGGFIKAVITIPQVIMLLIAGLCVGVGLLINSFVVLFTGRYYRPAYNWVLKYLNLDAKITFYIYGLTDKYPGFTFAINDSFKVDLPYPTIPSRVFAFPFIGFIVRYILMLPFFLFLNIIYNAAWLMIISSPWPVLFKKYYPESTFEMAVDATRLRYAVMLYFSGISDTYPTFKILKKHLVIKLIFIAVSVAYLVFSFASGFATSMQENNLRSNMEYQYPSESFNDFDY